MGYGALDGFVGEEGGDGDLVCGGVDLGEVCRCWESECDDSDTSFALGIESQLLHHPAEFEDGFLPVQVL